MKIGIPIATGSRGEVISLIDNKADGFGNDVATAPSKVSILSVRTEYVPGKTPLNITFSLQDAQGLIVVGSDRLPITHLVQLLVLPVDAACSTFAACQRLQLQPAESYYSSGAQETTSTALLRQTAFKYCQAGVEDVQLRLFLSTGDDLDVTGATESELVTLQTSTVVACLPCVAGWERIEVVTEEFPAGLWTCRPCEKNQYVVDPNRHFCQQCPAGAKCSEGTFTPHDPVDSVWNATQMGVNRLVQCPAGYVLVRDEEKPTLDRCIPCPPYTYSVEEAAFGVRPLWTGVCVCSCLCFGIPQAC